MMRRRAFRIVAGKGFLEVLAQDLELEFIISRFFHAALSQINGVLITDGELVGFFVVPILLRTVCQAYHQSLNTACRD